MNSILLLLFFFSICLYCNDALSFHRGGKKTRHLKRKAKQLKQSGSEDNLEKVFLAVQNLALQFEGIKESLSVAFSALQNSTDTKFEVIQADMNGLRNDLSDLKGNFYESDLRSKAAVMYGVSWSKRKYFQGVYQVVNHLHKLLGPDPRDKLQRRATAKLTRELHPILRMYYDSVITFVQRFVADLDESKHPNKQLLLAKLASILAKGTPSVIVANLIGFFSSDSIANNTWRLRLVCLKNAGTLLNTDSPSAAELEELEREDGPGMLLLSAVAQARIWSMEQSLGALDLRSYFERGLVNPLFDIDEVKEADLRGDAEASDYSLRLSAGEIKSSVSNLDRAWKQLKHFLLMMEYAANVILDTPRPASDLIARVFVPEQVIPRDRPAEDYTPMNGHGISYNLHIV